MDDAAWTQLSELLFKQATKPCNCPQDDPHKPRKTDMACRTCREKIYHVSLVMNAVREGVKADGRGDRNVEKLRKAMKAASFDSRVPAKIEVARLMVAGKWKVQKHETLEESLG